MREPFPNTVCPSPRTTAMRVLALGSYAVSAILVIGGATILVIDARSEAMGGGAA